MRAGGEAVVATLTSDAAGYAREVQVTLKATGLRAELDLRNEKIGYEVREHFLANVPVLLAVGRREAERRRVAVRRAGDSLRPVLAPGGCVSALATEGSPLDTPGETD